MWWKMKLDAMVAAGEALAASDGRKKANDAAWKSALTAHGELSFTT